MLRQTSTSQGNATSDQSDQCCGRPVLCQGNATSDAVAEQGNVRAVLRRTNGVIIRLMAPTHNQTMTYDEAGTHVQRAI